MQHYDSLWVRGPGPNSVYWQGPTPQITSIAPVDTSPISTVTVPYRPFFSPTGLQAKGMYGGCGCSGGYGDSKLSQNQRLLLYAGVLGVGYFLLTQIQTTGRLKKNPKMNFGERIVRIGGGAALAGLGALGWLGPQAGEPFSTVIGLPISAGGIYLAISGFTSPEKAKAIRREVKG